MFGTTIGKGVGAHVKQNVVYEKSKPKKTRVPRYHEYIADYGGCGHWRLIWPQLLLNSTQRIVGSNSSSMIIGDSYYRDIDSVRVQRQVTPVQLKFVKHLKDMSSKYKFKLIYDVDDIFVLEDIPMYNSYRSAYENKELQESGKTILGMVDKVTVPCEQMKQYYSKYNKNVQVIPNYPPKFWLDNLYEPDNINNVYNDKKIKPKIMYAGSSAHFDIKNRNKGVDDLSHVIDMIKKTVDEYEWIFMGAIPPGLVDEVRQKKITIYQWQNIYDLPRFVKNLNISVFVAPLNDNTFNRCKSDIKIIEAGALGIPCVCQDLPTYEKSPLRFETGPELHDIIKELLTDEDYYMQMSKKYNDIVQSRWLDDNLDVYIKLFSK
mgnify:CR=1 FL=1